MTVLKRHFQALRRWLVGARVRRSFPELLDEALHGGDRICLRASSIERALVTGTTVPRQRSRGSLRFSRPTQAHQEDR